MSIIRSISGLRATYPDDLTEELVVKYCYAFDKICPNGKIVIGRDGRPSGKRIEEVVCDTFQKIGRDVMLIGVVPTPTVQLMAEKNADIAGGIAITASHNPSQWNGLKFINTLGTFIDAKENAKLWHQVDTFQNLDLSSTKGKVETSETALAEHIKIIKDIPLFDNEVVEKIKKRNYKVVVDAVNASGSVVVPQMLRDFNCEVIELYCNGTGEFPHTPEPLPVNLTDLAKAVKEHKADFGVAVDPDADRLVLIDENGEPIGEERTICVAVSAVLRNYAKLSGYANALTVNLSTTMLAEKIGKQYGASCTYSPVGEINVVNKMKATKAVIGGEGSGGVILPACHYGRDSMVGIALLLIFLAQEDLSLSQAVAKFPKFEMLKTKMPFSGDINQMVDKIKQLFPSEKIDLQDGVKVIAEDYWVQLRKSNTEPIIRIIAEGNDAKKVNSLIEKVRGNIFE